MPYIGNLGTNSIKEKKTSAPSVLYMQKGITVGSLLSLLVG